MINVLGTLPENATFSDIYNPEFGQDLANLGRQGAQGMSFGSSDEIEAALRSLLGEKSYSENLDSIRSELAKFDEENPEASMGAFIAGIAPTLGISAPALFTSLATRLGKYGASSALGALGGFTEGFLTGEGTRDRIEEGATWGIIGGLTGPVLIKGLELAPQVAQFFSNLKNKLSNVRMGPNALGSNLGNLRFTKPELEPVEEYLYRKSTLPEAKQRAEEVNRIVNEARFEGRELKPAEIDHIRTIENTLDIDYLRKIINRPMDRESRRKRAVELGYDLDDLWYRGRKSRENQIEFSGRPFMSKEPILASTYVPSYGGGRHQGELAELVVSDRLNPTRITVDPGVPEANWRAIPMETAKMKIDDGDWHLVKDNPNFSHIGKNIYSGANMKEQFFTTDDITKAANETMPMLKDDYAVPKPIIVDFENIVDRGPHDSYGSLISDYDLQVSPSPNVPIRNQSVIGGGSSIRKTSAIFEPLLRNMKNLNFVVPIAGALPLITPEGER